MTKKLALALLLLAASPASAQHRHSAGDMPQEVGQSAFAALAEIVTELRADKKTDWSKVNIDALRQHLVDMDNVTTRSQVVTNEQDGQIIFTVTGEGGVIGSIQRMMNAHAPMVAGETGWSVTVKDQADGAAMSISTDEEEQILVKALGFFGVMTIGAHHQMHHMMIALGHDPH